MSVVRRVTTAVVAVVAVAAVLPTVAAGAAGPAKIAWPARGEAAFAIGSAAPTTSPRGREVPIASVAKIMTAYLVLRHAPLRPRSNGFSLVVTRHDVADTARRAADDQSTVPVRVGEHLTERQALAALLLPSANNIAIMLARRVAGSERAFVRQMNHEAAALHMRHTVYTDPSGFAASTRSTAHDQLILTDTAMGIPAFAAMVRRHSYAIPVAGRVDNTDWLLGHDGFVGVKTGSDDAAGGCFAFRVIRRVRGREVVLTGVVLGQPGGDLISAALRAARRLAHSVLAHSVLATAAGR